MRIELGEYLPDVPPISNPGLTAAINCIPYNGFYSPFNDAEVYVQTALATQALGFFSTKDINGNAYSYCGDVSDLFAMTAGAKWETATHASGVYATALTDAWEFAQWGNNVIATNWTDQVQDITLGGTTFANLTGSPPRARHVGVVKDFIVLGNVSDISSGASIPNRVHWSGFNDKTAWTPSTATQCDYQDLRGEGGWVQKVVGGEYGTIFQERAITRMTYIGTPFIFQFDTLEENRGTPAPQSVGKVGQNIFYLGWDGFYYFDGLRSADIGVGRVYNSFIRDLQSQHITRVNFASDPANTLVFWAYPGEGSVGGIPNRIIIFNYGSNKWAGPVDITTQIICRIQEMGYTLDTLDTISTSIDSGVFATFDAKAYMGGALSLGGFDSSGRLVRFTGSPMTAIFETGDRQLLQGRKTLVTLVAPLVEGESASASIAISSRDKLNDSASYGGSVLMNAHGECPIIKEGRYHRFKLTVADGFTHASAIEVEGSPGGRY